METSAQHTPKRNPNLESCMQPWCSVESGLVEFALPWTTPLKGLQEAESPPQQPGPVMGLGFRV